jgi:hypothetical protein
MRHLSTTRIAVAALASCLALTVTATGVGAGGTAQPPQTDCPQRAQPLPAAALAPASNVAVRSQRDRYEELGTRPLVVRAALAEFDEARGPEARRDCGRRVERRTVVVYLESTSPAFRRRNPSLSQAVVFVSRFPGGDYRVWRVVR